MSLVSGVVQEMKCVQVTDTYHFDVLLLMLCYVLNVDVLWVLLCESLIGSFDGREEGLDAC
jgi:hypothetical protein